MDDFSKQFDQLIKAKYSDLVWDSPDQVKKLKSNQQKNQSSRRNENLKRLREKYQRALDQPPPNQFASNSYHYNRPYDYNRPVQHPYVDIDTSQYYIGYRSFIIDDYGRIKSTAIKNPGDWHPGECIAVCRRAMGSLGSTSATTHKAPFLDCHCGFYGCHNMEHVRRHVGLPQTPRRIYAAIQQWGKCIQHSDGIRSEYAKVIAFQWTPGVLEGVKPVDPDWVCMHLRDDCPVCGSRKSKMVTPSGGIVIDEIPEHIQALARQYAVPLFNTYVNLTYYASEFGKTY